MNTEPKSDLVVDLSGTQPTETSVAGYTPRNASILERAGALLAALVITGSVAGYAYHTTYRESTTLRTLAASVPLATVADRAPHAPNPFATVALEARSAIVYDLREHKALFARDADLQVPLASLTKLMTAVVALEVLDEATGITITSSSMLREGDAGLVHGEVWTRDDLITFALLTSSNDAADALARAYGTDAFVARMNTKARELGLSATFYDPTGLDLSPSKPGASGSATDVALLLEELARVSGHILEGTSYDARSLVTDRALHSAQNTNIMTGSIPNLLGGKTGYTDLAGGNLAVLFDPGPGTPIAIVVTGSSREGRFTDVEILVDATIAYITSGWYADPLP